MKKLSQILAVGVITLTPFAISSSALAVGTCAVGFTGPDSNNLCISKTQVACSVVNANTVTVTNENLQIAASGNAASTDNTNAGLATTGSVTNSNGTTFNVTITNGTVASPAGACVAAATVPATETLGGGRGSATPPVATVTPSVPAPQGKGAASGLPNTSGDLTLPYVAGLVGIFGAGAVMSRLAVMAYSRLKS